MPDSLVNEAQLNQVLGSKKFSGTAVANTAEEAEALAKSMAQQSAQQATGPNTQYTSFDDIKIRIDTNPATGGLMYTATYTLNAVNAPIQQADPVTPAEQTNLNNTTQTTEPSTQAITQANQADAFYNGTGSASVTPVVATPVVQSSAGSQRAIVNPLLDYDSYTYNLSLHMMGINNFNNLVDNSNPNKTYVPVNVLVTSAGKWGSGFSRDPSFTEDFFFDDLKMKTYINTTARNRNSNLIEMSFTIIEPMGFTFINRLLEAAYRVNGGSGNYLQMPYMVQIDFYGYKDGQIGPTPIPNLTKHIPIRLINLKSKVTSKGTEYQIDAVPFNHQAFSQVNVTTPVALTVTGSTVQSIFGTGAIDATAQAKLAQRTQLQREQSELQAFLQTKGDWYDVLESQEVAKNRLSAVTNQLQNEYSSFATNGYTDAVNAYFVDLKEQRSLQIPNVVRVEFHPDIANQRIFPTSGPVTVGQTNASGTTQTADKTAVQAAGGIEKGRLNFNGTTMNIPAGTTIDRLIDWAVRNSEYITNQISDPTVLKDIQAGKNFNVPMKWYRIVPKIKILEFDPTLNRYALDITYYVKPYYLSTKYPFAPRGRIGGFVKEYDYLFTGKNKDVIDLQLDFDMLYLVEMTAARTKRAVNETARQVGTPNYNPNQPAATPVIVNDPNSRDPMNVAPVAVAIVSDNKATTERSGALPQLSVAAGDVHRSLMLGAKGDMININLKIIGDPHYIKQDDIFYNQDNIINSAQLTPNQSLYMDGGELYVFVNFESPVDYNEATGIADVKNSRYRYSEFSGVYKIITIDSVFTKGKFEQTLNLAKLLYDQEGNPLLSSTNNRAETNAAQALSPLVANAPVRFLGPAINLARLNPANNATAALNAVAYGALGGASASSIAGQLTQIGTQALSQAAGKVIGGAVDKAVAAVKDVFTTPTFSNNPADYKDFSATDSNYGAFGEPPTASAAGDLGGATEAGGFYDADAMAEAAAAMDIDNISIAEGLEDLDFGTGVEFGSLDLGDFL